MTQDFAGSDSGRLTHLESIRGLAALQVLLLHVFSAFFPAVVFLGTEPAWARILHGSPLFLLWDGYSAVYIFFVLSGLVLTFAFQRQADRPLAALRARVVRLFIPAFCACLLAAPFALAFGGLQQEAGRLTGSNWLTHVWSPPAGLAYWLKDAALDPLFLGYDSSYPFAAPGFAESVRHAYVAPLWSLSVELQGSVLVLGLVLASRKVKFWPLWLSALAVLMFRSHFICFLAGHALALALQARRKAGRAPYLPSTAVIALLTLGGLLCVQEEFGRYPEFGRFAVTSALCDLSLFSLPCQAFPQKIYGAIFIFVGLACSAPLSRLLTKPAFVALGRLSFPIYLVHWPILMGLGSFVLIALAPKLGVAGAGLAAGLLTVAATFALARPFSRIDAWAVALSRRCRAAPAPKTGEEPQLASAA
ncbi:Peptidoglycan/LPS O-acetylase OafA/YrhL, contains acyltransferase and SGNH-hydrolase domains [Rhodoblastus acidophilus]|uniref:Peptidoglycan/LPS O-acetylase OafA/YrhL, contains acyltransferase and SGNH-hydrolase domains n=1 Tax=Rhodoblastus acidophilus TaxID=1074 RepID=A0A212REU4_RHOAC|nr:acyltransferase [Rhodoblastus acidophilus]PPQ39694.1 acyltransferase [Rhodoblastus acidophilus]RAI24476.1 acyltransferase [Rhodoblastus acidophilus]SNB70901.1 Peptidoglycan/LPS O-acetylase OafA/YrhL, contains acyltransferase and SGNH-hydrolase domains [Rhodoblastus acidophilus]